MADKNQYAHLSQPENNYQDLSSPIGSRSIPERTINPSDEFSNPTVYPGFNQLSRQEKLNRIKNSLFDPMNNDPFSYGASISPDAYKGFSQSILNTPSEIWNIFSNHKAPLANYAPDTMESHAGNIAGNLSTFEAPTGTLGLGLKGLSKVPFVGKGIDLLSKYKESRPWLNTLTDILKTTGNSAIFNARGQENPENALFEGGAYGAGTSMLTNLASTQNPIVKMAARLGLGALLGNQAGHPVYGALAGLTLPPVAEMLGMSNKNAIARDSLSGLTIKDIAKSKVANDRLGTPITPAQASGNPVTSDYEGNLRRSSPETAQVGYRLEENQRNQQTKAINTMLDKIYTPSKANEDAINLAYKKAEQMNINPSWVDKMKQDPIMKSAFDSVARSAAFKNVPEHNYKYLAQVDRTLWRQYKGLRFTDPNSAYEILQVKNSFNNALKQHNPDYEAATKLAQPKIVRENLEDKLNKQQEDYTGKNFYSKFLNARQPYKQLLTDTKNFPEAQQMIKDMREGWKHLYNIKGVSQAKAQSESGYSQSRDQFNAIIEHMKKIAGINRDKDALKFIYSQDWDKEGFNRIMKIKDNQIRNRELLNMLGRFAVKIGLMPDNDQSQGRNKQ